MSLNKELIADFTDWSIDDLELILVEKSKVALPDHVKIRKKHLIKEATDIMAKYSITSKRNTIKAIIGFKKIEDDRSHHDADTDDCHTDDRHTDDRHTDDRHTDDRHTDDCHTECPHTEDAHTIEDEAHPIDACTEDAHDEDACDEDAHDEDAHDEDAHGEDAYTVDDGTSRDGGKHNGYFEAIKLDFSKYSNKRQAELILERASHLLKYCDFSGVGITYSANGGQTKTIKQVYAAGGAFTGIRGANQAEVMVEIEKLLKNRYSELQHRFRIFPITTMTYGGVDPQTQVADDIEYIKRHIDRNWACLGWKNQQSDTRWAIGGGIAGALPKAVGQLIQDALNELEAQAYAQRPPPPVS